ncbi:hypothetical protein K6025_05190 [Ehrlichia sp. JZT12]
MKEEDYQRNNGLSNSVSICSNNGNKIGSSNLLFVKKLCKKLKIEKEGE